jgi:stage II sporulation protein D
VGEEISYRAPAEALKAQAVASRTFALSRCATQSAEPFDLGVSQNYQVYSGFAAESKPGFEQVKSAIDNTRGQVIYYRGKLIEAYFHANAGGYTENSENVWQQALPYLRGVPSPWDEYALRYQPQSPDGWPAYSYHWDKTITRTELEQRLANWNTAHADQPDQIIDVGEVIALVPSQVGADGNRSVSGRVTRLMLIGNAGQKELRGETARSLLGLRSTLFTLQPDSQVFRLGANQQPQEQQEGGTLRALPGQGAYGPVNQGAATYWVVGSGGIKREIPKFFGSLSFSGYGHGHGLGMSQWGAWGMAVSGYAYQDILEYYYNQNKHDGSLQIVPYAHN